MSRVLVIGMGKIGRLRTERLIEMGVDVYCHDIDPDVAIPAQAKRMDSSQVFVDGALEGFSHAVISTPIRSHFQCFNELRGAGFSGPVLVEKPATLSQAEYEIFLSDTQGGVYVGLTERFNPSYRLLKEKMPLSRTVHIVFSRTAGRDPALPKESSLDDVAVHDLDLVSNLWGLKPSDIELIDNRSSGDTFWARFLIHSSDGERPVIADFVWSNDTAIKERSIIVRQERRTWRIDLMSKSVEESKGVGDRLRHISYPIEQVSDAITLELRAFLSGRGTSVAEARTAHQLLFNLREL